MNTDLSLILKLQGLDLHAAELSQEIAALPKRIAEIEKTLEAHKRRLEIDKAALAANQKERKSLEGDIKVQEQKMSKLRDQMLGAKTNEQYRAFQHEIEFCEKEIRRFEDRILDLMGEAESLDGNVKAAEKSLAEEGKSVEAEKKAARERTEVTQKKLAEMKVERQALAAQAKTEYLSNYERIRKRAPQGMALAEAAEGRCTVCNMIVRPQVMQELRIGAEALIFCENCKRILYYNPVIAIDENAGP
jgi:predicted  nucleic acid-binding Zn-ribbon protein